MDFSLGNTSNRFNYGDLGWMLYLIEEVSGLAGTKRGTRIPQIKYSKHNLGRS